MADNVIDQPVIQTGNVGEPDLKAQLAEQMAISLNITNPSALPKVPTEEASAGAVVTNDTPVVTVDNAPVEPFSILREKFQYQTPEDAIKEIEELRTFKQQPRNPEFVVPDDDSHKILKALAAGKKEDVYKYLDQEMRLERLISGEVTADSAVDVVKMGMQLKHPTLTSEEINYLFNKEYALPQKPEQVIGEEQADYDQRISEWQNQVNDKKMGLMIQAKMSKPDLEKAKTTFVFPEIDTPVDDGYIQYQKMLDEKAKYDQETVEAYRKMTPKNIETKLNFKDKDNNIDFDFQFEPDPEGFANAVKIVSDADLFWQTFINSDGSPNRQKLLDAIYYANNKEKVLLSALNQAKNAAIKAQLPDNNGNGIVRQMAQQQEPNELDTAMKMALRGYI